MPLLRGRDSSESRVTFSSSTECYCNGERRLGELELHCSGTCKRWFHKSCLKDLTHIEGLPFMVSYTFICRGCSPERQESWTIKTTSTNFTHMCIMAMANLTYDRQKKLSVEGQTGSGLTDECRFFNFTEEIIPFFESQWENLTSMQRRVKNTWHSTLFKTLARDVDLFETPPNDANSFALKEKDLSKIGPMHETVIQLYKRNAGTTSNLQPSTSSNFLSVSVSIEQPFPSIKLEDFNELGPKTRGAKRRTAVEQLTVVQPPKKTKMFINVSDFSSPQIGAINGPVDTPFNREGYRYYLVEWDPNFPNKNKVDAEESSARGIPAHFCRLVHNPQVTLSQNDRANQMILSDDNLTVTGFEGYSVSRATHSVSHGTWYYEVEFLSQPESSHARVGWAQSCAVLQACLGYSKFSYSWRSKRGTVFHEGRGRRYNDGIGYKQGDVLGCLISLPELEDIVHGQGFPYADVLPQSRKNCDLIRFKHAMFFEEKEDPEQALKKLRPLKGSRIEFFLNGRPCGTAFEDLYFGAYFPAISIFQTAKLRCNFGPDFKCPPTVCLDGTARPMSDRTEEVHAEQALSDILFGVEHAEEIQRKECKYFAIQ